jgi:preprotein translocase subunit SecA
VLLCLPLMSLFKKIFGDEDQKIIDKYQAIIPSINALESEVSKLSDGELKNKTNVFRGRLSEGENLDNILPEAFAVVREVAKRKLGQRHYDVQLLGGMVINSGSVVEMRTGEGKTLVATLPAYLNSLSGKGVHVVTVNDYLSQRDAVWMGQIYNALGVSVGIITQNGSYIYDETHITDKDEVRDEKGSYEIVHDFLRPVNRTESYLADITYGTNSEFGFDYLRDNIEYDANRIRQRDLNFAIVDEVDSILIDEARTPLIISGPAEDSEEFYKTFAKISQLLNEGEDYTIDEKLKSIHLTDAGISKAEKSLGVENIYTDKGVKYVHHLETAVRAKALFKNDKDYVVKNDEIIIVDEFTGRMQPGRRWSEGLHQAIEAKENVSIQKESRTFASITYQNFFRMYNKLSGMTGTAKTSSEEFLKVYGLNTLVLPTHNKIRRIDNNDLIFQTEKGKFQAIAKKVKELNQKGQPVLIGTVSIEKNELLSAFLAKEGVPHKMLNAKNHEQEGAIIAEAGRKGGVTIATNMAGRGVDIKLGGIPYVEEKSEEVKNIGGLFVLGTERHEARRIDNQLRGRSGRQGDPGETQFFVSLEDSLMRVFANDMIKNMMGRFGIPEDEPIENSIITKSLETAQTRIEGFHFDSRKHILDFDNVLNTQREAVYKRRRSVVNGDAETIFKEIDLIVKDNEEMRAVILDKKSSIGEKDFSESLRRLILQSIDTFWIDHLENMNYLRNSVNLRAYGQRDPLIEYQKEGRRMFTDMQEAVDEQILSLIPNIGAGAFAKEEERLKKAVAEAKAVGGNQDSVSVINSEKYGRNDLVTITKDGEEQTLKYKKAESLLEEGWVIKD